MSVTFSINSSSFDKEVIASLAKLNNQTQVRQNLIIRNQPIDKIFENKKKEMIRDFLSHPVTKEILAGPKAFNSSGTLGGYGNLFSFIGFSQGDRPIEPILALLEKTQLLVSRFTPRGNLRVTIELPSTRQIFSVTPMPWAPGLSWAQRIEMGISGYPNYIAKKNSGRSTGGIQSESTLFSGKFQNTKYISAFIMKWERIFKNIYKL